MITCGVIYCAHTDRYIRMAAQSASSVREHAPDLPIHLFTDPAGRQKIEGHHHLFDKMIVLPEMHRRSKVDVMHQSEFERTLYLDADTWVVADFRDMFQLLDRFDIALSHAAARNHPLTLATWRKKLPPSFPQYSSGLILFKGVEGVLSLLRAWGPAFREAGFQKDQVTLRELLWDSDLRIATLPPEYHARRKENIDLWRKRPRDAKLRIICHGRDAAKRMLR